MRPMGINMMQISPEFARTDREANTRCSFSEWRLMRGRACAFVLPTTPKTRRFPVKGARALARSSNLILIEDTDTRH